MFLLNYTSKPFLCKNRHEDCILTFVTEFICAFSNWAKYNFVFVFFLYALNKSLNIKSASVPNT